MAALTHPDFIGRASSVYRQCPNLRQFQIPNPGFAIFTSTESGMISSFPAITDEPNDLPSAFRGNYRFLVFWMLVLMQRGSNRQSVNKNRNHQ